MNYLELARKIAHLSLPFIFFSTLQKVFLKQFWTGEEQVWKLQLRHSVFLLANARKSRKEEEKVEKERGYSF